MPGQYAFRMPADEDSARALQESVAKAVAAAGVDLPGDTMRFTGPPPGAFGFGEGFLSFLGGAWDALMKVPDAVAAVADGIKTWLENRPGGKTVEIECADGTKLKLTGDMSGEEIAAILESATGSK